MSGGTVYSRRIIQLVVQTTGLQQQAASAAKSLGSIEKAVNTVKNAFLAFGVFKAADVFRDIVDSATSMNNILSTLNQTTAQAAHTQAALFGIANAARVPVDGLAKLYVRLESNLGKLRVTEGQVLTVTKAVSQGLQLGGASAGEAASAVLQLSQAFASGRLQGDEFRAVLENAPALAKALAHELFLLGKLTEDSIGALRDSSRSGNLGTPELFQAFLNAAQKIDDQFQKMTPTLSQFFTVLRNESLRAFNNLNQTYDILKTLGNGITFLTDHVQQLGEALLYLAVGVISRYVSIALTTLVAGIGEAVTITGVFTGALTGITALFGGLPGLILAATGALALYFSKLNESQADRQKRLDAQFAGMDPLKLNKFITENIPVFDQLDARIRALKETAEGDQSNKSFLDNIFGDGKAKEIKNLEDQLADLGSQLDAATAQQNLFKESINSTNFEESKKSVEAFNKAIGEMWRQEVVAQAELDALKRGDKSKYETIINNEKQYQAFMQEKASLESKMKGQLTKDQEDELRIRIKQTVGLEQQAAAQLKIVNKSISDRSAANKAADTKRKEDQAREDRKWDKFLNDDLPNFDKRVQDTRDQNELAKEQLSDVGKEKGLLEEIGAERRGIAAYRVLENRAAEIGLKLDQQAADELKNRLIDTEKLAVRARLANEQFQQLQNAMEEGDPTLKLQRELREINEAQINTDVPQADTEQKRQALEDHLADVRAELTGIGIAAEKLKGLNDPFGNLLEGIMKFNEAAENTHGSTIKNIELIGQGALSSLKFIGDEAALLGVDNFEFSKQIAVAQAIINSALAVSEVLAHVPAPASFALAGVMAGLTAAVVARIEAQEAPARAFGGAVSAGIRYNTGERGPEMFRDVSGRQIFIPSAAGTVTPGAGRGGGVTVINHGPPLAVKDTKQDANGNLQIIVALAAQASEDRFEASLRSGQGKYSRSLAQHTTAKRAY